jgi:predicted RNase H-like nuclease
MTDPVVVIGIDLAWGEKNPDGVTVWTFGNGIENPATAMKTDLARGDLELFDRIERAAIFESVMITVDAPLICINETGSRPVDKLCSNQYRLHEAGCYPVNRRLCHRPFRIASGLAERGYTLTTSLEKSKRIAAEVYPHPATIRLFDLEKTIKYKKGRVAKKRAEFARYQDCLRNYLGESLPWALESPEIGELLSVLWKKGYEDQVDSILCAIIGSLHLLHRGAQSEILGDDHEGHMLIPQPQRRIET